MDKALVKYRRTQLIKLLEEKYLLIPHVNTDFFWHLFSGTSKVPDKHKDKEKYNLQGKTKVPIFCSKESILDLPDIIEVLNTYELNARPTLFFYLEKSESSWPQNKLAIVMAICSTNRIEEVDCRLLAELKEKGFANVLMVALRKGSDPTKISTIHNNFVDSGVGVQKEILQFVYNKGNVMMDASANICNILLFFELAKSAFQH